MIPQTLCDTQSLGKEKLDLIPLIWDQSQIYVSL